MLLLEEIWAFIVLTLCLETSAMLLLCPFMHGYPYHHIAHLHHRTTPNTLMQVIVIVIVILQSFGESEGPASTDKAIYLL
jgi:hypothetical protein